MSKIHDFVHNRLDKSAVFTVIGIAILFSSAVIVTLIAPGLIDPTWTEPTNSYQVQMYELMDPHLYISSSSGMGERQFVYHLQKNYSILAFQENESVRIVTTPELEKYVTYPNDSKLKLTSRLLLLRSPQPNSDMSKKAEEVRNQMRKEWNKPDVPYPIFDVLELYDPQKESVFSLAPVDGIIENWVDQNNYTFLDIPSHAYYQSSGTVYIKNPIEYRISLVKEGEDEFWSYNPNGTIIQTLDHLKSHPLNFLSRQELIYMGERIFAAEGCWYCHTDQTRTLVQDTVVNGSDSFPAPPSTANEYIYQKITFPGTRRIGPDLSRVGIKRPSRDWHKGHFWSPKTASRGSIMPSFKHFFDDDPRGTLESRPGIPNYKFEAILQYLMTKGTRITPPTEAWWIGKDPVQTKQIIEGKKIIK